MFCLTHFASSNNIYDIQVGQQSIYTKKVFWNNYPERVNSHLEQAKRYVHKDFALFAFVRYTPVQKVGLYLLDYLRFIGYLNVENKTPLLYYEVNSKKFL